MKALSSPRALGALLLALPLMIGLAISIFPGYDARPEYFAGEFHNIVDAGRRYLVALGLLVVVAGHLSVLVVGLLASPLRAETNSLLAVLGGLGVSAVGFAIAGITGIPVWLWAGRVADGSETLGAMAARSQGLGSISQTVLLMFGLGGLLVAMSVLGVVATTRGWAPKPLFWVLVVAATALTGAAAFDSGPVIWLAFGALPVLWASVFGGVLLARGELATPAALADDIEHAVAQQIGASSTQHAHREASHKPLAEDWWLASDGRWHPPGSPPPSAQSPRDL